LPKKKGGKNILILSLEVMGGVDYLGISLLRGREKVDFQTVIGKTLMGISTKKIPQWARKTQSGSELALISYTQGEESSWGALAGGGGKALGR